jgi:hypothetical protein
MERVRLWSSVARRRRRIGIVLAGISVTLSITAVINAWLAVTTDEWWPFVISAAELIGAVASAPCAYRYLRRAWATATILCEPAMRSRPRNETAL